MVRGYGEWELKELSKPGVPELLLTIDLCREHGPLIIEPSRVLHFSVQGKCCVVLRNPLNPEASEKHCSRS